VRYLCQCQKDRSSDEMVNWIMHSRSQSDLRPVIPDYALDMHTGDGQAMGRGREHFWQEGAKIEPELPGRDTTYQQRLLNVLTQAENDETG
jgi:hypothetical protein